MTYTSEEKARMDALLDSFSDYIQSNKHFEIVYSNKLGFLTFAVHDGKPLDFDWIDSFDDLLDALFSEVLSDVRDMQLQGQHDARIAFPIEINETRRRIKSILLQINNPEERAHYMEAMEKFLMENSLKARHKIPFKFH